MFDGVFQSQDTSLRLRFISHISVFLCHSNHNTLMSWSSNDGREHSSGCVIASETCFYHAGSIVDNECLGFFVHYVSGKVSLRRLTNQPLKSRRENVKQKNTLADPHAGGILTVVSADGG